MLPHLDAAAAAGSSPRYIAGLLLLFGGLFNLHMVAQSLVFKTEGAIGVGLVNACRGAVITVVVSLLFCDVARPHLCLTRQTALSALVTTIGGAVYVLAGRQRQPPPAAATAAAAAERREVVKGRSASVAENGAAPAQKDKDA